MRSKTAPPSQRQGMSLLRLDDECILCDSAGRPLCVLNETAAALWELCDGDTDVSEMIDAICSLCAVLRDDARTQVESTLAAFERLELIRWS